MTTQGSADGESKPPYHFRRTRLRREQTHAAARPYTNAKARRTKSAAKPRGSRGEKFPDKVKRSRAELDRLWADTGQSWVPPFRWFRDRSQPLTPDTVSGNDIVNIYSVSKACVLMKIPLEKLYKPGGLLYEEARKATKHPGIIVWKSTFAHAMWQWLQVHGPKVTCADHEGSVRSADVDMGGVSQNEDGDGDVDESPAPMLRSSKTPSCSVQVAEPLAYDHPESSIDEPRHNLSDARPSPRPSPESEIEGLQSIIDMEEDESHSEAAGDECHQTILEWSREKRGATPRQHDEDSINSGDRPYEAIGAARMDYPSSDTRLASHQSAIINEALTQLNDPSAFLTDQTMRVVQTEMFSVLKREIFLKTPNTHVFGPLFLQLDDPVQCQELPNTSLFHAAQTLIIPLHHRKPEEHWTLARIDLTSRRVEWYDPLPRESRTHKVKRGLLWWANETFPGEGAFRFHVLVRAPCIATQNDGHKCGAYVLHIMCCWLRNEPVPDTADFDVNFDENHRELIRMVERAASSLSEDRRVSEDPEMPGRTTQEFLRPEERHCIPDEEGSQSDSDHPDQDQPIQMSESSQRPTSAESGIGNWPARAIQDFARSPIVETKPNLAGANSHYQMLQSQQTLYDGMVRIEEDRHKVAMKALAFTTKALAFTTKALEDAQSRNNPQEIAQWVRWNAHKKREEEKARRDLDALRAIQFEASKKLGAAWSSVAIEQLMLRVPPGLEEGPGASNDV